MATEAENPEGDLKPAARIAQLDAVERTKLYANAFKHMTTLAGAILAFVLTSVDKIPDKTSEWLLCALATKATFSAGFPQHSASP